MKDYIFRRYDIRGKVGSEFCIDEVYDLAHSIAHYFKKNYPKVACVAVGADGRIHSPAIKKELCRALQDSGLNVIFIGICPSPVLYFSLYTLPVEAGIMITASHNGKEYNGFKLCLNKNSIWGDAIQQIKKYVYKKILFHAKKRGMYQEKNMVTEYVDWLKNHFSELVNMDVCAIIDCGNGAAGTVLPELITAMRWRHIDLLYAEVDGTYPNHPADPTIEENMFTLKQMLQRHTKKIGIGFDGDCDRMVAMTCKGELIQGDKLLAVFSNILLKKHPGATVIFDIKCSSGLQDLLNAWGANAIMSASGHSIIKEQMKRYDALLAGELSCHFFFNDRYFGYDDGIYAMMRLFEVLHKTHKNLDQLVAIFPHKVNTPEIRIIVSDELSKKIVKMVKQSFMQRNDVELITIDGVRAVFTDGWGMIRSSNTQPAICLRFESDTKDGLRRIQQDFKQVLLPFFKSTLLAEYFGDI